MCVQVCVCLCGFTLNCLQPVIPAAGQAKPNLSALCLSPSLTAAHIPHESKLKAVHSSARGAKNESIAFELLSHTGIGICVGILRLWHGENHFHSTMRCRSCSGLQNLQFFFCTRLRRVAIGSNLNCKRKILDSPFWFLVKCK